MTAHSSIPSPRVRRVVMLVMLSAAVAACGGESPDSGELSDEAFVAEASTVCEDAYTTINEISASIDRSEPGAADLVARDFVPAVTELQDRLEAVVPSDSLARGYAEALAAQQENLDAVTRDASSVFDLDIAPVNEQFDDLGLAACGSESRG